MRHLPVLLTIFFSLILTSCYTLVLKDGRKCKVYNLAKDNIKADAIDTTRFVRMPFKLSDYIHKKAYYKGKRVIVPLRGVDIHLLADTRGEYYLYFFNPTCSGNVEALRNLNSLAKEGLNIMIVSNSRSYNIIDNRLERTEFAQYPYYTIETEDYTNYLLWRELGFLQEACPECYERYPDRIPSVQMLLVKDGSMKLIEYRSDDNPLNND